MMNVSTIKRKTTGVSVGTLLAGLLFSAPVSAQVATDIPGKNSLYANQRNSTILTGEIDNILGGEGFGADLMSGIQGYGLDVASAIAWQVADKAVKAIADATIFAPIATTIMEVYEKAKQLKLANALNAVKEVHRDALSRQLKLQYQKYKLNYGQWQAKARKTPGLNRSKTVEQTKDETEALYPNYANVMYEFDGVHEDSIVNASPDMGFHLFAAASALSNHDDIDLKLALADKQYIDSTGGEVFAMSAYDRIRLRQEARLEASVRNAALIQMQQQVRARINLERSRMMHKSRNNYIRLNSQNH